MDIWRCKFAEYMSQTIFVKDADNEGFINLGALVTTPDLSEVAPMRYAGLADMNTMNIPFFVDERKASPSC